MIVNNFEIRELPNGYVDCVAWNGAIMATENSVSDAVSWAQGDTAPELDSAARAELSTADKIHHAPDAAGYYWAKLVEPRKEPQGEDWTSTDWEIVHVDENYGDDEDYWRVYVPGIGPGQLIDAFVWGPPISDQKPS